MNEEARLGAYQYALRVVRAMGYRASGERAAEKLISKAWEAHLNNGRSFAEIFMIGLNHAQRKRGIMELN